MKKDYKKINLLFLVLISTGISFAQEIVSIGNAEGSAGQPVSRFFRYHASEMIYLQDEIDVDGEVTKLAFNKLSGSNTDPIENVSIYFKTSTSATLSTGTASLDGYSLVYEGDFTNDAASGWMEVDLDIPFEYTNEEHLHVFIVKGFQSDLGSAQFARFANTSTGSDLRHRNYNDDSNAWSETRTMTASAARPDIQLTLSAMEVCDEPLDNTVVLTDGVLTAEQTGTTYQWWDCDANTPIDGATEISYTPTAHGNYKVVLDAGGVCETESACIEVSSLVGLEKYAMEWNIYPNPVTDVLVIEGLPIGVEVEFYDALGKKVYTFISSAATSTVNLSNFEKGIYFLMFEHNTVVQTKKLIKK